MKEVARENTKGFYFSWNLTTLLPNDSQKWYLYRRNILHFLTHSSVKEQSCSFLKILTSRVKDSNTTQWILLNSLTSFTPKYYHLIIIINMNFPTLFYTFIECIVLYIFWTWLSEYFSSETLYILQFCKDVSIFILLYHF